MLMLTRYLGQTIQVLPDERNKIQIKVTRVRVDDKRVDFEIDYGHETKTMKGVYATGSSIVRIDNDPMIFMLVQNVHPAGAVKIGIEAPNYVKIVRGELQFHERKFDRKISTTDQTVRKTPLGGGPLRGGKETSDEGFAEGL